jgi:nicotinate phosphoribosyltransferase
MIEAALASGRADRQCRFEVFTRRLPAGRRFGVVAGTGRLMDALADFRFDGATLEWLARENVLNDETLARLEGSTFSGSIEGYAEGELFFPHSPVLSVIGTFAEAVAVETLILSVLNHDSAIASAAARMVAAADGTPLSEMGSRRTHEDSAVAAARAAHIAGFAATSNLAAGERWNIPTMGTAAHAFTLLHDSEEEAFRAQVAALGPGTTLLVDTYDVERGVDTAVRVAGTELGAVRLDSGDLPQLVRQVRAQLDSLGAVTTRITVTNELDEHAIAALRGSPVDAFGVGTALVTGSGAPTAGFVYKLVAVEDAEAGGWRPVAKASAGKASRGAAKRGRRLIGGDGVARAELVAVDETRDGVPDAPAEPDELREAGASIRDLTVPYVTNGEADARYRGPEGVRRARAHHAAAITELPVDGLRLAAGEPVLPTVFQ